MSGSYLEDLGLNSLSPIMAPHAGSVDDDPDDFDLDLSLFTNSTFFDADYSPVGIRGGGNPGGKPDDGGQIGGLTGFSDFECFEPFRDFPPLPAFAVGDALQLGSSFTTTPDYLPITTAPAPTSQANSPASHESPLSGAPRAKKQKTSSPISPPIVAAEDKRRRNTAASARFRVKKKQREQQLQETLKETVDKTQRLEERVRDLERENRWLKNLVVEKKETGSSEEGIKPEMPLKLE